MALLLSAGCNCNTILSTAESPTGQYEAQTYTIACGVMVPFNAYARIKTAGSTTWTDIVAIHEAAFLPKLQWLGPEELRVTLDCDPVGACAPDNKRYWSVSANKRWRDVRITYAVGARLRQSVSSDVLKRLPQ
jgi:hypothetical protein